MMIVKRFLVLPYLKDLFFSLSPWFVVGFDRSLYNLLFVVAPQFADSESREGCQQTTTACSQHKVKNVVHLLPNLS